MNPIVNTNLYKHITAAIPELDGVQVIELLLSACRTTQVDFDKPSVDGAITWRNTPQGGDFWSSFQNAIERLRRKQGEDRIGFLERYKDIINQVNAGLF